MRGSIAFCGMILSAVAGAAASYILVKRMYDERANKDIAEAKEYYRKKFGVTEETPEQAKEEKKEASEPKSAPVREPEVIFEISDDEENEDEEEEDDEEDEDDEDGPEIRDPDKGLYFEHGNTGIRLVTEEELRDSDYSHVSYTYFADGMLVDDFDDILNDDETEEAVGTAALAELGEAGKDRIFVLNDTQNLAIEVLFDERRAMDIPKYAHRFEGK